MKRVRFAAVLCLLAVLTLPLPASAQRRDDGDFNVVTRIIRFIQAHLPPIFGSQILEDYPMPPKP